MESKDLRHQAGNYSQTKALQHLTAKAVAAGDNVPFPVHLHIVPCDLCSHSCSFCSYRWEGNPSNEKFYTINSDGSKNNNPNRKWPNGKLVEVVADAASHGTKAIQFTGGGEPTLHPELNDAMWACDQRDVDFALVTHGGHLHESDAMEILMHSKWVRISVDAGNVVDYCRIRSIKERFWWQMWKNAQDLCRMKMDSGSDVVIGMGFVVTKENYRGVFEFAEKARKAGVDNVRISAVFQPDGEGYFDDFIDEARDLCRRCESLATKDFEVYNSFGNRVDDLSVGNPDYETCYYQMHTSYLGGDQNAYRCCQTSYNEIGLLGSFAGRKLSDLWFSDEVQRSLKEFQAPSCARCMFNVQNNVIREAVEEGYEVQEKTAHGNFV